MNSSLMYKFRRIAAIIAAVLLCLTLCSCSEEVALYRIDSLKWFSNDSVTYSVDYTYTGDNRPSVVSVNYSFSSEESYTDSFTYDEEGMVSAERVYFSGKRMQLTPKKITSQKYILYDEQGKEFVTITFDNTGFIVSYRYANGLISEYAFTYDEYGVPIGFKQLDVRPSGSNRLIEYSIEYKGENKFIIKNKDKNAQENGYYEAVYTKLITEE